MNTSYLDLLEDLTIFGGDIQTEADALVTHLADGTPINDVWQEIRDVLRVWNEHLDPLTSLTSYQTISPAEMVLQSADGSRMEIASEHGVPKGQPTEPALLLGFSFDDYDIATRFTWRFLRSANAAQIRNSTDNILSAHNKARTNSILNRLFDNTAWPTPEGNNSYPVWSGDGMAPLKHYGTSFPGSHNHFLVSGASQVDSADVESLQQLLLEHGFGRQQGQQLILFCSDVQAEQIATFRAGVESRPSGPKAVFDFVKSAGAPAYLSSESVIGPVAPESMSGLEVLGSYGRFWVVPHPAIPTGYVAAVCSSGANSPLNPIGFRQHPREQYRGLRMIPGNQTGYPLVESFAVAGHGVGVRHRSAAAILQVKASGSYDVPSINL